MTIELTPPVETPVASGGRTFWSDDEKSAVAIAYGSGNKTAEDFFRDVGIHYPRGKVRTIKAYLTFLNRLGPKEDRNHAVYNDLLRLRHVEVLKERAAEEARKAAVSAIKVDPWLDEIDPSPVVPQKSGAPVQGSLFPAKSLAGTPTKAVVKPDPGAIVPVYYAIEPSLQDAPFYGAGELSRIFNIKRSRVSDAFAYGYIPTVASGDGEAVITLVVFRPLYEAMCEGHAWEHACHLAAVALRPPMVEHKVEPLMSADKLYAITEVDSFDDPNPDALSYFTVAQAAKTFNISAQTVLDAIEKALLPAVQIGVGIGGRAPVGPSWKIRRDDIAILKKERLTNATFASTCCRVFPVISCQNDTSIISDAFDSIEVDPAVTSDQHRRFTLEGLRGGVFSMDEAVRLLGGASDPVKTAWAFGLLREGRITVEQTVKLLG